MRLSGRLLVDGRLLPGHLEVAAGCIAAVELDPALASDAAALVIAPGLVDVHVHGFGGCDPLDDLAGMARALARAGTTAFQPTLFPRAPERLGADAERVWSAARALPPGSGARVLGLHIEGPFVSRAAAGALPPDDLAEPSVDALRAILGPSTGDGRGIRRMTLAPELPGSADLVAELVRSGVRVSLGHSLATSAQARSAARAGATGATHLFNAMRPWHHREVGLAGAALLDDALVPELIGDLVHVGPEAVEIALAARGARHLCLVSDALKGAGTGCDRFEWHGRSHLVRAGAAFYPVEREGAEPRLAGSATGQLEAVRRLVGRGVVGLADALTMASHAPARSLGAETDVGRIAPGCRADLIALALPDLALAGVWIDGEPIDL